MSFIYIFFYSVNCFLILKFNIDFQTTVTVYVTSNTVTPVGECLALFRFGNAGNTSRVCCSKPKCLILVWRCISQGYLSF